MNPAPLDGPSLPDGTASTKTIRSMTGYVHQCAQIPLGRLEIEIRAVNSRFSDLHFRLTEECRPLEPRLRKAITACVKRGKVECRLSLQRLHSATPPPLDNNRLAGLLTLVQQIQTQVPDAAPPSIADYLRWLQSSESAEIMDDPHRSPPDPDMLWQHVEPLLKNCLIAFQETRTREGQQLGQVIRQQSHQMRLLAEQLHLRLPELHAAAEAKLRERLHNAIQGLPVQIPVEETSARIRQEISLLSLKDDITEELDRLSVHLQAIEDILTNGGAVGKQLDFLMQELNREANTIASKSMAIFITDTALALKLHIEQLREQVQNLE